MHRGALSVPAKAKTFRSYLYRSIMALFALFVNLSAQTNFCFDEKLIVPLNTASLFGRIRHFPMLSARALSVFLRGIHTESYVSSGSK